MARTTIPMFLALVALASCARAPERGTDSLLAVDTLKAATDTIGATTATDSTATKTPPAGTKSGTKSGTKTGTKLGRDSAFPPPRNLPQLDTVRRRPPG